MAKHDTPVPVRILRQAMKENSEIFPLIARARNFYKNAEWAKYVFMPSDFISEFLKEQGNFDPRKDYGYSAIVALACSWRQSQGIYRFHEEVEKEFKAMPINGKIPVEVFFHLPEWTVFIETPGLRLPRAGSAKPGTIVDVAGIFVMLDYNIKLNDNIYPPGYEMILGFVYADDDLSILPLMIALDRSDTIDNAMDRFLQVCINTVNRDVEKGYLTHEYAIWWKHRSKNWIHAWKESVAKALPYVLYLCSINSEIRDIKKTNKVPGNPQPITTKKGEKLIPACAPTVWECGYRTGPILKAYRREVSEYKGGTHASPRPHLRAAHYQHYRVGPRKANGEKIPLDKQGVELKWIAPILVNASGPDDLVPVVREIKGEEENAEI